MSLEENKALIHRFFKAWNSGNVDLFDELMAPDYFDNDALPDQTQWLEGYKHLARLYLRILPDLNATIDDLIVMDDKEAVRSTLSGTHREEFMVRAIELLMVSLLRNGQAVAEVVKVLSNKYKISTLKKIDKLNLPFFFY